MEQESTELIRQLHQIRTLFNDTLPTDKDVTKRYAWIIAKALLREHKHISSFECRSMLADYLKLSVERPSELHSAILAAAVKMAHTYVDFHFAAFLRAWDLHNIRPEDKKRYTTKDGMVFPSLLERVATLYCKSILMYPGDVLPEEQSAAMFRIAGYTISHMLVTRIREAVSKEGRKLIFVTLTSPDGIEVETIANALQLSPLHPLPEGKRHYVNIGQLYRCLLRPKSSLPPASGSSTATVLNSSAAPALSSSTAPVLNSSVPPALSSSAAPVLSSSVPSALSSPTAPVLSSCAAESTSSSTLIIAYLSQQKPQDLFPTAIGYIEALDTTHGHMHIYDQHSRHFVAPIQRFSRETAGTFVRFIPIIPQASKFKTAIILTTVPSSSLRATVPSSSLHATVPSSSLHATVPSSSLHATVPSDSSEGLTLLREIRITNINKEKGYAAWELVDKSHPITELLSPLQLSLGETSPSFTSGYLKLTPEGFPQVPGTCATGPISHGQSLLALIYLKRGMDRQKRPHIAKLFS